MANDIQDIKPQWLNVARRLQSVVRKNYGCAVVHMDLLIQADTPVYWLEPTIRRIEPRVDDATELLKKLRAICGDDAKAVLEVMLQHLGR